jgi:membrane dipeptidase
VPRNLTDAMLRAIAKNGGAACVNFYVGFLDARAFEAINAAEDRLKAKGINVPKLTIAEERKLVTEELQGFVLPDAGVVADHLQHMIKVAGVDHVCLGSDFDGIPLPPRGLEDASKMPALTQALLERGMSEADIGKILGGNLLRVLEANE